MDTVNRLAANGAKYVEEKWGLTDQYQPTEFFRGSPWLRLATASGTHELSSGEISVRVAPAADADANDDTSTRSL